MCLYRRQNTVPTRLKCCCQRCPSTLGCSCSGQGSQRFRATPSSLNKQRVDLLFVALACAARATAAKKIVSMEQLLFKTVSVSFQRLLMSSSLTASSASAFASTLHM